MYSKSIQKLIDLFSKFPGVGQRSAARFVFYLLRIKEEKVEELVSAISDLKRNVKTCKLCFSHFEGEGELCPICSDNRRDGTILCIVEKEQDLMSIERTRKYKGLYFVLGRAIKAVRKEEIKKLRIKELRERLKNSPEIKEVIVATNPTTEGRATALYLERELKQFGVKITHLARGLPVGGELEYADEETLSSALEGRR